MIILLTKRGEELQLREKNKQIPSPGPAEQMFRAEAEGIWRRLLDPTLIFRWLEWKINELSLDIEVLKTEIEDLNNQVSELEKNSWWIARARVASFSPNVILSSPPDFRQGVKRAWDEYQSEKGRIREAISHKEDKTYDDPFMDCVGLGVAAPRT